MRKWFSCNPKTQQVEAITPSTEYFAQPHEDLLFWAHGLEEWVSAEVAGPFFAALSPEDLTPRQYAPAEEEPKKSRWLN